MFGRGELRQIRKAAERDRDVSHLGDWQFGRVVCRTGGTPLPGRVLAAATSVHYAPPEHIFGKPYDPVCLDGVTVPPAALPVPEIRAHELDRGRVIGFNAALDGENRLYCQGNVQTGEDVGRVVRRNSQDHDGFLATLEAGELVVRFGCGAARRHIPGHAVLLSNNEPGNYGRFLLGVLPQLLYLRAAALPFDYYVTSDRANWLLTAIAELGLPAKPLMLVKEVCGDAFDTLTVLDDVHGNGVIASFVRDEMRALASKFAKRSDARPAARIYVSRALSRVARARYRLMMNEAEDIEPAAAGRGFTVVYPETISWQEQIALFHTADTIAGPSGSGMLNAAFAAPGARVLDMESFHTTLRQHARTYASTEKRYAFAFGVVDETDSNSTVTFRRWTLPLAVFHQGMDWLIG